MPIGSWSLNAAVLCMTHGFYHTKFGSVTGHVDANRPCDLLTITRVTAVGSAPFVGLTLGFQSPTIPTFVTTNTVLTASQNMVLADATLGPLVLTLPPAATHAGRTIEVKKTDPTTNTVTLTGAVIDDGATAVLTTRYQSINMRSDGTQWRVV